MLSTFPTHANYSYFHGDVPLEHVAAMLASSPPGSYVVRFNTRNTIDLPFTVSFTDSQSILLHARMMRTNSGTLLIFNEVHSVQKIHKQI